MKNSLKFIGIFALAAIIGFSMIACELEVMPVFDELDTGAWTLATGSQGTKVNFITNVDGVAGTASAVDLVRNNHYVVSVRDLTYNTTEWYTLTAGGALGATAYDNFMEAADVSVALTATGAPGGLARISSFLKPGHEYNFFAVVKPSGTNTALAAAGTNSVAPSLSWEIPEATAWTDNTTFVDWWDDLNAYIPEVKKLGPSITGITQVATWITAVETWIETNKTAVEAHIEAINDYIDSQLEIIDDFVMDEDQDWNKWLDGITNTFPTLTGYTFDDVDDLDTVTFPTLTFANNVPDPVAAGAIASALWEQIKAWVVEATVIYEEDGVTVDEPGLAWISTLTPPARATAVTPSSATIITIEIAPGVAATGAVQGVNRVAGGNTIVQLPTLATGTLITIGNVGAVANMHIYWGGTVRNLADSWEGGVFNANGYFVGINTSGRLNFTGLATNPAATGSLGGTTTLRPLSTSLSAWEAGDEYLTITGITADFRLTISYQ